MYHLTQTSLSEYGFKMKCTLNSERARVYLLMQKYEYCVQNVTALLMKYREEYLDENEELGDNKISTIKRWRRKFLQLCREGKCNHSDVKECFVLNEVEQKKAIELVQVHKEVFA